MGLLLEIRKFLSKILKNPVKAGIFAYIFYKIIEKEFKEGIDLSEDIQVISVKGDKELIYDTNTKKWSVIKGNKILFIGDENKAKKLMGENMNKLESIHEKICKEAFKKGDKVKTSDGMSGYVTAVDSKWITVQYDKNYGNIKKGDKSQYVVDDLKKESVCKEQSGNLVFVDYETAEQARKMLDRNMDVSFAAGKRDTLVVEDKAMAKNILQRKGMKGLDKQSFKLESIHKKVCKEAKFTITFNDIKTADDAQSELSDNKIYAGLSGKTIVVGTKNDLDKALKILRKVMTIPDSAVRSEM
jgi:preprotein translocase subunit YajC